MRSLAVVVEPRDAERVRRILKERGILRRDLRTLRKGDKVLFPVAYPLEGFEVVEEDFPPVRRVPAFRLPFDLVGDIAILRHPGVGEDLLREEAERILEGIQRVRLVLLDEGVRGEMRLHTLRVLAGRGPPRTVHRENGIKLYLELDKVYFSPRLSYERGRVASQVSPGERVFDMFAGAGPFSVLLAKKGAIVFSCDINPHAARLILKNAELNGVADRVSVFNMDAASAAGLLDPVDRIIMNLPTASTRFLKHAKEVLKKGGILHLYTIEGRRKRIPFPECFAILQRRVVHSYSPGKDVVVYDLKKLK